MQGVLIYTTLNCVSITAGFYTQLAPVFGVMYEPVQGVGLPSASEHFKGVWDRESACGGWWWEAMQQRHCTRLYSTWCYSRVSWIHVTTFNSS